MNRWMREKMAEIEAERNINMELEGGGKKAGWRKEDLEVQSQQHI